MSRRRAWWIAAAAAAVVLLTGGLALDLWGRWPTGPDLMSCAAGPDAGCLHAGSVRWSVELAGEFEVRSRTDPDALLNEPRLGWRAPDPAAAYDEARVYVAAGGEVRGHDVRTGQRLWATQLSRPQRPDGNGPLETRLTAMNGLLALGFGQREPAPAPPAAFAPTRIDLLATDTGRLVGSFAPSAGTQDVLAVEQDRVLLLGRTFVESREMSTGRRVWSVPLEPWRGIARHGPILYLDRFGGGTAGQPWPNSSVSTLQRVDLSTGGTLSPLALPAPAQGLVRVEAAAADLVLLAIRDADPDAGARLVALRPADSTVAWQARPDYPPAPRIQPDVENTWVDEPAGLAIVLDTTRRFTGYHLGSGAVAFRGVREDDASVRQVWGTAGTGIESQRAAGVRWVGRDLRTGARLWRSPELSLASPLYYDEPFWSYPHLPVANPPVLLAMRCASGAPPRHAGAGREKPCAKPRLVAVSPGPYPWP